MTQENSPDESVLAKFVRASEDEKREIYKRVMEDASASQIDQLNLARERLKQRGGLSLEQLTEIFKDFPDDCDYCGKVVR